MNEHELTYMHAYTHTNMQPRVVLIFQFVENAGMASRESRRPCVVLATAFICRLDVAEEEDPLS